jgi:uncharacterized protein
MEETLRARVEDEVAAAVLWRLIDHLQHRTDAQNVDLMGLAGFCRNCIANWLAEASEESGNQLNSEQAREAVYGMSYDEWKRRFQLPASPEQLERMELSVKLNQS